MLCARDPAASAGRAHRLMTLRRGGEAGGRLSFVVSVLAGGDSINVDAAVKLCAFLSQRRTLTFHGASVSIRIRASTHLMGTDMTRADDGALRLPSQALALGRARGEDIITDSGACAPTTTESYWRPQTASPHACAGGLVPHFWVV